MRTSQFTERELGRAEVANAQGLGGCVGSRAMQAVGSGAGVLALCALMLKRNMETEFWRKKTKDRIALFFARRKGKQSRLVPQEPTPPPCPWGIEEVLYPGACGLGEAIRLRVMKVLNFFSFPSATVWTELVSGGSPTRSGGPEVIGLTFFLKCRMLQGACVGGRRSGAECNS